jgi:hypothetical protein
MILVRFQVLMEMSMKMAVLWDVVPCSPVYMCDDMMMEAVSSSEMLVNTYQTTQCNIPEDSHIHKMILLPVSNSIKIQFYFLSRYNY